MSSYYDDASLVVIPSGYKTSKVYAEKPTDGSGDLAFTRTGDTATRVNSAGIIEKVRTNRALQSQTLSVSATWIPYSGTTVTADAIAAPDGTLTADRIAGTSAAFRGIRQTISSSAVPHTFSVYLKSATGSATTARIWVDSGVSVVNVTTDWQRFSVTATTASSFDVQISTAVSLAIDVYAWGAQVETGDIATAYIPTTTAAVSVGPVANVPRLDYLGSTCPRLILEPQRQNLVTFSEQLDNAAWIKDGITITANATTSPDGYTNADKLVASASAGDKITYQVFTPSSGAAYTASAYYKASEYTYAFMRLGGIDGAPYVIYNLATQSIVATSGLTSSTITSVGNGWYRITATATTTTTVLAPNVMIIPSTGYTLGGDNIPEFTGNGTSGGFVWGVQTEAGAYATSYIPTLASASTRSADACSKTGISSLIGQTEGVLFYDFVWNGNPTALGDYPVIIYGGSYIDFLGLSTYGSAPSFYSYVGGSNVVAINGSSMVVGQRYKMAMAYKLNDYAFYINGTQVGTVTSAGIPASMANLRTDNPFSGRVASTGVNQALLFKTRLTNAQLAELTTL